MMLIYHSSFVLPSETSKKTKDHSHSRSLVMSSKDTVISVVDKESDWSDVSSLTDESDSIFHSANGQTKVRDKVKGLPLVLDRHGVNSTQFHLVNSNSTI